MTFVNIVTTAEYLFFGSLIVAIIIQALMSFIPFGMGTKFPTLLRELTDPVLVPLRSVIPPVGMFDLSPMIGVILLFLFGQILVSVTRTLAGV